MALRRCSAVRSQLRFPQLKSSPLQDHSQDSPRPRRTPQPRVSPSPSQPWPSVQPAQGAASAHRAPQGRGLWGGRSLKGWVPARWRQESCRPRHTMGTVPEAAGRMRPSSSVPDSHPHPLGRRRHRATAPAPLPAGLGHGTGAGGGPPPRPGPSVTLSLSCSLPNSPTENPQAGTHGTGEPKLVEPHARASVPGDELQQSEAFALSDHIYLNILCVCVCSKIGYRINTCAL